MIRSTLGAPLGGTMRGGHQGLESLALSLITPANFGGGAGSCSPLMVVVALGEPGVPVVCICDWATGVTARNTAANIPYRMLICFFMVSCFFGGFLPVEFSIKQMFVPTVNPARVTNVYMRVGCISPAGCVEIRPWLRSL